MLSLDNQKKTFYSSFEMPKTASIFVNILLCQPETESFNSFSLCYCYLYLITLKYCADYEISLSDYSFQLNHPFEQTICLQYNIRYSSLLCSQVP